MKKIIISSVCTLAVSLCGTYAANQSGLDLQNIFTNSSFEKQVQQTDIDSQEIEDSSQEEESTVEENISTDTIENISTEIESSKITETADTENTSNEAKADTTDTTQTTEKQYSKVQGASTKVNESSEQDSMTTDKTVANTSNNTEAATVKTTSDADSVQTSNNQTIVYKGIDLSTCDSIQEAVTKLQQNGYCVSSNVDVSDITSVEDLTKYIQKGSTVSNTTTNSNQTTNTSNNTATTNTNNNTTTTQDTASSTNSNSSSNSSNSSYASQVLALVNEERAKQGLSALTTTATLTSAANVRAEETLQSFSHTRPNGTTFATALDEFGITYQTCGENIAYGQKTPQEVVTAWMNSPGHRANILNSNFNKLGVGVYQSSNGTIYWSQLFTN